MVKALKEITLWVVVILLLVLTKHQAKHRCTDKSHVTCDGLCECDGLDCNGLDCN